MDFIIPLKGPSLWSLLNQLVGSRLSCIQAPPHLLQLPDHQFNKWMKCEMQQLDQIETPFANVIKTELVKLDLTVISIIQSSIQTVPFVVTGKKVNVEMALLVIFDMDLRNLVGTYKEETTIIKCQSTDLNSSQFLIYLMKSPLTVLLSKPGGSLATRFSFLDCSCFRVYTRGAASHIRKVEIKNHYQLAKIEKRHKSSVE